jgi:hypothetical protein
VNVKKKINEDGTPLSDGDSRLQNPPGRVGTKIFWHPPLF